MQLKLQAELFWGRGGQPPRYSWKLIGSPWYMQDVEVSDWG